MLLLLLLPVIAPLECRNGHSRTLPLKRILLLQISLLVPASDVLPRRCSCSQSGCSCWFLWFSSHCSQYCRSSGRGATQQAMLYEAKKLISG